LVTSSSTISTSRRIVAACSVSRAEGFDKGGGFGHDGEPRGERRAEPDGAKRAPL
jgi:hypothetical protein